MTDKRFEMIEKKIELLEEAMSIIAPSVRQLQKLYDEICHENKRFNELVEENIKMLTKGNKNG